ncbi:MAG: L,D-transpeptidase [Paracoccaceae bacterium]
MPRLIRRRDLISGAAGAIAVAAAGPLVAQETVAATPELPPEMMPRYMRLATPLAPYEIHVDPGAFALYWTLPDNNSIRYAVGIGRANLYESGEFTIGAKKEWPSWTPTPEMIEREPEQYEQYADGMPGGPDNPLGARALYLFQPQIGDTFLRIHGTNAPSTIGTAVSNGCVRLVNSHIMHLYEQVPLDVRAVLY